jgi:alpha-tubulin suppressor-like RCC1 family protein
LCYGGSLWLWGDNTYGQIGDQTTLYRSSPVQTISGGVDWCSNNLGGRHALAIKLDGKVWSWGWNAYGQLGDNTTTNKSSPVIAVNANQWQQVAGGFDFSLAIDDNYDLWSWGHNNKYQLGLGDTLNRSSPTISSISANWMYIAAGYDHGAALDSNNKLYCWGSNAYGQCGNPIATPQIISPTETSEGGSNWVNVACGKYYTIALKNDGGIWAWGNNNQGQFGNNTVINSDAPLQVQYTDWVNLATGGEFSAAIRWQLAPTPTPSYTPSPTPSGSASPTPSITPSVTSSPTPSPTVGCVIEPLTIMAAYDPSAIGNPCGDDEHKCDYASFTLTVNGIVLGIVNLNNRSDGGPRVVNFALSSSQVNNLANLDPEQDLLFHFTCNTQCGVACGPISPTNFCTYDYNSITNSWSLTSSAFGPDCGCYSPQKLELLYDLFGLSTFTIAPQKFARGTNGWCLSRTTANWLVDGYDGCHDGTIWLSITGDDTGKIYHDGCYSRGVTINICDPKPTSTPTISPTLSPSPTPSPSASASPTPSPTPSSTEPTPTPSGSGPTPSPTPSPSPSGTEPTATPTPSPSPSPSASPSPTPSPSISPTLTPTPTPTECPIVFDVANILYSQSSVYYLNQPATNAVMNDGNYAQTLQTGTDGGGLQWVMMDLQCVFRVTSVLVGCDFDYTLIGGWGPNYTENKDVQYSYDGVNWFYLFNTGIFTQGLQSYPVDVTCRYIRIVNFSNGFLAVTQFTVGVTSNPTPTSSPTPCGTGPTPTETPLPTASPLPTSSVTPSASPAPSATPNPTPSGTEPTPLPTSSPTPSPSSTIPPPSCIILNTAAGMVITPNYPYGYAYETGPFNFASNDLFADFITTNTSDLSFSWQKNLPIGVGNFTALLILNSVEVMRWGAGYPDFTFTNYDTPAGSVLTFIITNIGALAVPAGAMSGAVTVLNCGLTPRPSVTPTATPTPSPTESPSPTPSPSSSATPIPTASPFPTIPPAGANLWLWGENNFGQLGDGTTNYRSSPVQTLLSGNYWGKLALGAFHSAGILKDNTLWIWGRNNFGQLGQNNTNNLSSPAQTISSTANWYYVATGYNSTGAIKSDGTLWMWGYNILGTLGDLTVINRSSPVLTYAGGNNWETLSIGRNHTGAIKSDGSLWMWGGNVNGQLGINSLIATSSAVQTFVGGNNWENVYCGDNFTLAIDKVGEIWGWGLNSTGQLGNETYVSTSVPVQVIGYGSTWTDAAAGSGFSGALGNFNPPPTMSPSPSASATPSPTPLPSASSTPNPTASVTPSPTPSASGPTPSPSSSPSPTPSQSISPTPTGTGATMTPTPSPSMSATPTGTEATMTPTPSPSESPSPTPSPSMSATPTGTEATMTPTPSPSESPSPTPSPSISPSVTVSPTMSPTPSGTESTPTATPSPSPSLSATATPLPTTTASTPTPTPLPSQPGYYLYLWGGNAYGQLSQNNLTNYSFPVQILGNTKLWTGVSTGVDAAGALKTDGSMWVWGSNFAGQLANETTVSASSLVQLGIGVSQWIQISAGQNTMGGISRPN